MRVEYFEDTDTLQITFKDGLVTETIDLDEGTLLERDVEGRLVSMTLEHARAHRSREPALQDLPRLVGGLIAAVAGAPRSLRRGSARSARSPDGCQYRP